MVPDGYVWSLREEADTWRWIVSTRDARTVVTEGVASTRAQAAALLVRAISRGAAADEARLAHS